jgi:hypothetical protein
MIARVLAAAQVTIHAGWGGTPRQNHAQGIVTGWPRPPQAARGAQRIKPGPGDALTRPLSHFAGFIPVMGIAG